MVLTNRRNRYKDARVTVGRSCANDQTQRRMIMAPLYRTNKKIFVTDLAYGSSRSDQLRIRAVSSNTEHKESTGFRSVVDDMRDRQLHSQAPIVRLALYLSDAEAHRQT